MAPTNLGHFLGISRIPAKARGKIQGTLSRHLEMNSDLAYLPSSEVGVELGSTRLLATQVRPPGNLVFANQWMNERDYNNLFSLSVSKSTQKK
jgi:hypothetical protein